MRLRQVHHCTYILCTWWVRWVLWLSCFTCNACVPNGDHTSHAFHVSHALYVHHMHVSTYVKARKGTINASVNQDSSPGKYLIFQNLIQGFEPKINITLTIEDCNFGILYSQYNKACFYHILLLLRSYTFYSICACHPCAGAMLISLYRSNFIRCPWRD